jgi:hypothetical protein
MNRDVA